MHKLRKLGMVQEELQVSQTKLVSNIPTTSLSVQCSSLTKKILLAIFIVYCLSLTNLFLNIQFFLFLQKNSPDRLSMSIYH